MLGGLFHFQLQFAAGRDLMHGQFDMDQQQELQESKQGLCFWKNVDGFGYLGGLMEQEEDLIRSKRRRSHHNYSRGRPVYPHCVSQWNGLTVCVNEIILGLFEWSKPSDPRTSFVCSCPCVR
ncbi:uncharacterized protein [Populus alba]|uniref:uncharacterized protein isoform X2 n=3 Tax=Populus alba TaxID=43335 RepID=UPI003CC73A11